jgi:hypothetical protein
VKRLLAIGLVLLSTSAWAEWVWFGANQRGTVYYVDPSTKKDGSRPRVWQFVIYSETKSNGTRSYKSLKEADCSGGRSRDLTSLYFYDADANNLKNIENTPDEWSYPVPESVSESLFIYLCGKAP